MSKRISGKMMANLPPKSLFLIALAIVFAAVWTIWLSGAPPIAQAQQPPQAREPLYMQQLPEAQQLPQATSAPDNATCLLCHGQPGMTARFGSDEVSVYVDGKAYGDSVHGKQLACVDCHADKTAFPHVKSTASSARAYAVESSKACAQCHKSVSEEYRDSVHGQANGQANANGNNAAATCGDCHTAHAIQKGTTLSYSTDACNQCHSKVVETYKTSVHGQLVFAGRKDAANCIDCHTLGSSAHQMQSVDATTSSGKLVIAETCGKCHTKVAENYASTFHGKAMRMGVSGAAPTCVDCHGAYGVQRVHGPESPLTETKMADNCAKCHQGANANFANGWMGHEEPSPSWFPLTYITERFLFYLMTSVVAFGILHVELDVLRWFVSGRKKKHGHGEGGRDEGRDNQVGQGVDDQDTGKEGKDDGVRY